MLRVALAQINTTVGDLTGNREKILSAIKQAHDKDADIVVFPELAITGYPPEDLLYKENFISANIKILQSLLKEVNDITVILGFVDRDKEGRVYNAAAIIHEEEIAGIYHKEQLPNYGVFDEKRYFEAGSNNKIYSLKGITFAVNICEDIWMDHGKGVWEMQAKMGAQLLINLSSSPFDLTKLERRQKLLKSRAQETGAFVTYANLVGGQDELVFDGGSFVYDSQGKMIAMGKQFEEDLVVADLDIGDKHARIRYPEEIPLVRLDQVEVSKEKKKGSIPKHIAPQLNTVERIYSALILGTRDYIQKNGFKKVLIGLSGGIDSAVVAVIAAEAIGKENVVGVTMPSKFNSVETIMDAKKLAENLGIKLIELPIENIFDAYLIGLSKEFVGLQSNIAEENIQARIRGNLLMALSNKFGWLVLTTGNKSEVAVGYCTLYGDMSGGFGLIKDVSKTQVYELAKYINRQKKGLIPGTIIKRAPTAELRANQKDQDTLPPYEVLDNILKDYIEEHQSFTRLSKKADKEIVKKVMQMVDQNEYKRRQAPPGIKISPRAFGKDWRLPITNKYREF